MLLQVVEERAHLRGLHPALVVVEQDVVRLVDDLEALDVALAEVEVLAQHRQEASKSLVLRASTQTGIASDADARHLRAQVGRHLARLLPVARGDADQARLERVVLVLLAPVARGRRAACRSPATVNFSWAIRPSVASCSARSGAPRGGIITCWSQPRRDIVLPRSEISASRVPQLVERGLTHGSETLYGRRRRASTGSAGRRGSSEDDLPLR